MASIVVSGCVLRRPLGANLATHLHYLIGLRKLGHRVIYLEERAWQDARQAGEGREGSGVPRAGLVLLGDLLARCRVDIPVVWIDADAGLVGGMMWPQLHRRLSKADLLLDLGGHCWLEERALVGRRVLVDIDSEPIFATAGRQPDHDIYFSYRRNLQTSAGADWLPTVPPVVPRLWYGPAARAGMPIQVLPGAKIGVGPVEPGSRLADLLALPGRVPGPLWITLPERDAELGGRLARAGWTVRDSAGVEASLSAYRGRVIGAQAALSFLEAPAADAEGSWLSADSAYFLAAGRPVVVRETGAGSWLPTGEGVLTFDDLDGAVEGLERIRNNLPKYSQAARETTERVLHYRVVLPRLLEQALPRRLAAVA
ncbi:MAG: hypothetical protein ACLQBB_08840 [Solirubrobacteraceae bacterium]